MGIYAGFQPQALNPALYQVGVPIKALLDGYTFGAQTTTDLEVGSACFYVTNQGGSDITVSQTNSGTQKFAGVVRRSNTNYFAWGQTPAGYSTAIPQYQQASIITRGSVPIKLALALEAGAVPAIGSIVYAMNDGTFQSQTVGGTPPANGQATNFRIMRVPTGWVAGGVVVISNIDNVGA